MKNCIYTILLCCCTWLCGAQIVSPGTGERITFQDLTTHPSGAVTTSAAGFYHVSQSLTLTAGDTLVVDANLQQVTFAAGLTVQVNGVVLCEPRDNKALFQGTRQTESQNLVAFRFESPAVAEVSYIHFDSCKNILLNECNAWFDHCEFSHFDDKVFNYMSCNPTFQNSYFHNNQASAIASPANFKGSPRILNNYFYNNVLENSNTPQINLGPGDVDTIYIIGNHVEGVASTMSGGVGIANMMSLGNTCAIVRNNLVEHNRYGYTQNGNNVYALIEDNQFLNNDLEVNPNNGGSGISVYGYSTTCAAKVRRNLITGNLWGVTAIYYHAVDMGTAEDPGGNVIYNNGNGGVTYALFNNAFSPMSAVGNYWGNNTETFAEEVIFHYPDQPANNLGVVTYSPVMPLEPVVNGCKVYWPGTATEVNPYVGVLNVDSNLFELQYYYDYGLSLGFAVVELDLPLGVQAEMFDFEIYQDRSVDIRVDTYKVFTPHGDTAVWKVKLKTDINGVEEYQDDKVLVYPNPASNGYVNIKNDGEELMTVAIYNTMGQCLFSRKDAANTLQVSTTNWPAGLYLVKITQGNRTVTKKLTISQ